MAHGVRGATDAAGAGTPAAASRTAALEREGGRTEANALQLETRVADVAQPPLRVALEAAREKGAHARRHVRRERASVELAREDGRDRVRHGLALEQARAR